MEPVTSRQLLIQFQFAEIISKWKEDHMKSRWYNLNLAIIQLFRLKIE